MLNIDSGLELAIQAKISFSHLLTIRTENFQVEQRICIQITSNLLRQEEKYKQNT